MSSRRFSTNAELRQEAEAKARRTSVQSVKDTLKSCVGLKVEIPNLPLENVIGLPEIKAELLQTLGCGSGRDKVLLFGAFFCGKSRLVRGIATNLNASLIYVYEEEALVKWTNKLAVFTEALFEICTEKSRNTLLYIEHVNNIDLQILMKLLENVQRMWSDFGGGSSGSKSPWLAVIGSTYEPKFLKKEIIMHFNKRIYVPTPNFQERKQLILKYISECSTSNGEPVLKEKDIDWLAKKLYGCVPLEIETKVGEVLESRQIKDDVGKLAKGMDGMLFKRHVGKSEFKKVFKARASDPLETRTFGEFESFYKTYGNSTSYMSIQEREKHTFKEPDQQKADKQTKSK